LGAAGVLKSDDIDCQVSKNVPRPGGYRMAVVSVGDDFSYELQNLSSKWWAFGKEHTS
jgi:hypothetical protein